MQKFLKSVADNKFSKFKPVKIPQRNIKCLLVYEKIRICSWYPSSRIEKKSVNPIAKNCYTLVEKVVATATVA